MEKKLVDITEELDFDNMEKFENQTQLAADFTAKKNAGQVDCLETYLSQIVEKAPKTFSFACKHYAWLKTIDQQLKFKEEDREPLDPMIETLR